MISRIKALMLMALALMLSAAPAFAFTNPSAMTRNQYTAVKATSTAASVNSSAVAPLKVVRLDLHRQAVCRPDLG